jgi:hypothetical protein
MNIAKNSSISSCLCDYVDFIKRDSDIRRKRYWRAKKLGRKEYKARCETTYECRLYIGETPTEETKTMLGIDMFTANKIFRDEFWKELDTNEFARMKSWRKDRGDKK